MDIDLLSKMVKELILDNDKVVLPGLGCFVAEIVPSTFSDKGYTINPPYRKLSFRAKPDKGEELARFYADTNNVGYDVAGRIITDFVTELKSVLHQKKTVVFPSLGRLRATKENTVFFVADENLDIYPAGFGLEPVSLKTHQQTREEVSAAIEGLRSIFDTPAVHAADAFPSAQEASSGGDEAGSAPVLPSESETSGSEIVVNGNSENEVFDIVPSEIDKPELDGHGMDGQEEESSAKDTAWRTVPEKEVAEGIAEVSLEDASEDEPGTGGPAMANVPEISAEVSGAALASSSSNNEAGFMQPEVEVVPSSSSEAEKATEAEKTLAAEKAAAETRNEAAENKSDAESVAADAFCSGKKSIRKIVLWTIAGIAVLLIIAMAVYMALAIYSPEFLDSLLYTPEELDIINYNGKF